MPARGAKHGEITIENRVDPSLIPTLWRIYHESFKPLAKIALLDHNLTREMFEQLITDGRVIKVIAWKDGQPVGLATVTNFLDIVPQISPQFLRHRYPEHAARNAIFFGVFVCVDKSVRSSTVFSRLLAGIGQTAAAQSGIVVFDVSAANCRAGVDKMIGKVASWFADSTFERIDAQYYFASELPHPLERLPFSREPMPMPVIDLREHAVDTAGRSGETTSDDSSELGTDTEQALR